MNVRASLTSRSSLEQKLRADGVRTTPEFSPLLHERLMDRLRAQGMTAHDEPDARRWSRFAIGISSSIAAAAAVLVVTFVVFKPDQTAFVAKVDPVPGPPVVALPTEDLPIKETSNAMERAKYAYLDRDAHRLATFLANQLPSFGVPQTPK